MTHKEKAIETLDSVARWMKSSVFDYELTDLEETLNEVKEDYKKYLKAKNMEKISKECKDTYNGWKNYETWKVQHEILGPYEAYTEDLTTSAYLPTRNNYTDKDLIQVIAMRLMIDVENFINESPKVWSNMKIDKYNDIDFYEIATLMLDDYKTNTIVD